MAFLRVAEFKIAVPSTYHLTKKVALFALLLCLVTLTFLSTSFAMDGAYFQELIQRAQEKRLWERREWQVLLHYKPKLLMPGVKSLVDAESFFLAPDGKNDPEAELEATLASFFSSGTVGDEKQHPQCVFIARYHWLKQELHFDPKRLPEHPCPQFCTWIAELDPNEITLVFPVAFLNNPASMFGHTLLRIDAPSQDESTRLLAQTVSFVAITEQERGLSFALRGLFGGYPGKFSISRYSVRVKEYGDIDNRDIWEYRLDLTPAEILLMLMHVWELQSAYFDYFFLDENCSYQLLSLLEVARPSLHLTDQFQWWAIPADTVRGVTEVPGLLKGVRFRPARSTVLKQRALSMEKDLLVIAKDLAKGKIAANAEALQRLNPHDHAQALELAVEYLEYRQAFDALSYKPDDHHHHHLLPLLEARSRLDVPPQIPQFKTPEVRPDQGHKSARIGIGYGYEDPLQFLQFDFRHVYHDLLDPQGGFVRGAQLEFLNAAVRYYPSKDKVSLERIGFVDILSAVPHGRLLKPFSWKANVAIGRMRFASDDRPLTGQLNAGVGLSYDLPSKALVFAFAEGSAMMNDRFQKNVAMGVGSSLGIVHDFSKQWRIGLSARLLEFFQGITCTTYEIALNQRLSLSNQSALRLEISQKREFGSAFTEAALKWQVYF